MKIILLIITFLFTTTVFSDSSPERRLISDVNHLSFRKSPKDFELFFKQYEPINYKLIKVMEGTVEQKIKMKMNLTHTIQTNLRLFDQDFSMITAQNKMLFSLTHINDYTLSRFFRFNRWNPLINNLNMLFYLNQLYEKEVTLHLPKVNHALVILRVLIKTEGDPKIEEREIQYKGYNRFVWVNEKINIEYIFYPAKNIFSQNVGYTGKLRFTDRTLAKKANAHIRQVKSKLRHLLLENTSFSN